MGLIDQSVLIIQLRVKEYVGYEYMVLPSTIASLSRLLELLFLGTSRFFVFERKARRSLVCARFATDPPRGAGKKDTPQPNTSQ